MALTTCTECGSEVSDKAAVCMRCGAPVAASAPGMNAIPVAAVSQPKSIMWYWWLWGPAGLAAAFILFGALIPENVAKANRFARVCAEMANGNRVAQMQCDAEEARLRYEPSRSEQNPPLNTSFQVESPQAPSSASNEEIARQAMYPGLYGKPHKKQ